MTRAIRGTLVVGGMLALLGVLCGPAQAVSVTFTGPEEMVYDYTTMRCSDTDLPDGPTQAVRDSNNRIELMYANDGTRRMLGPDFNHLTHECLQRFPLVYDPNPGHYNYIHLIFGTYTENGRDIYAMVHNEWHGWEIPGACPAGIGKRRCGRGGIVFAVSHDNGDTFSQATPPDNFVATVPPRPGIDEARTGLFTPTNPIKRGSYFYSMALISGVGDQDVGVCVMRTQDITDPSSWRGWDGSAFSVRFRNPYYENVSPQQTHMCEPASYDEILEMSRSLTFSTYLNKFVVTGSAVKFDPGQNRNVYGFYYSTSDDLVHWSDRQLIMEIPSLLTHQCGGPDVGSYPSLIDQDSTDRNYRITDDTMYLYFTRMHYNDACQLTFDRDLIRIPIQFTQ